MLRQPTTPPMHSQRQRTALPTKIRLGAAALVESTRRTLPGCPSLFCLKVRLADSNLVLVSRKCPPRPLLVQVDL